MDKLERLSHLFLKFPGIGPRQSERFVYFLLRQDESYVKSLIESIQDVRAHTRLCTRSFQFFYTSDPDTKLSPIERDQSRDRTKLMIVEKDSDLEAVERTHLYSGVYFVLGGTAPLIPSKTSHARIPELVTRVQGDEDLKEIIIATSVTPEGEETARLIIEALDQLKKERGFTLTHLGKGVSTGTELEYIDRETLESALSNRRE